MPLENEMRTPKAYKGKTGVLSRAFAMIIILYVAMGVFGYLRYGDKIDSTITKNLDLDGPVDIGYVWFLLGWKEKRPINVVPSLLSFIDWLGRLKGCLHLVFLLRMEWLALLPLISVGPNTSYTESQMKAIKFTGNIFCERFLPP